MQRFSQRLDIRISATYIVVASAWIILSDSLLALALDRDAPGLVTASILKGLSFVAVTALALFTVLRAELRKRDQLEAARRQDITERIRTLEELRQSESRFATVFHQSPVPTGITRLEDGQIFDINNAFVKLFRYERDELIGRTALELGLWVDPEQRSSAMETVSKAGSVHGLEVQGRTRSGETNQLLASFELIALGDVPHIVGMFYDITEHKKLEEQTRYQALLLANVSDAVISTDVNFMIRSWNPAAQAIYGWKAEEVIGKPIDELVQGEYPDTTRAEAVHQLTTQGVWRGEAVHRRKDGSRVHLLTSTSYVSDSAGSRLGVVSVNRDITDVKKAQQELQEAERRRVELEKEKELLQLKERFLSVVSHEFRTPLAVIVSSADLVHNYYDRLPRERQLAYLEAVISQAHYMVSLLDDVLAVHKAQAGKLEFNPAPLDLLAFCETTLERIRAVDSGQHNLIFVHEGDLSGVTLDKKLVQHILINLLSNAIKYSPDGSDVRLEVSRNKDGVMLRVSDQGIGIPPDSEPHLYTPFYRASNTGDISGTGLGMTIVKDSVDRHSGTITYTSEEGRGTTFIVTLPAPDPDEENQ